MKYRSNADAFMDESICAPLCQHPTCWLSSRRIQKGFPRFGNFQESASDSDDDSLPTLKVYNMLDDYGPSERDKHLKVRSNSVPSSSQIRAAHKRHGTDAPYTTPATLSQTSKEPSHIRTCSQESVKLTPTPGGDNPLPSLKQIEVHEVFDLDDLHKTWKDTFAATKYYVWVPNSNCKASLPVRSLTIQQMSKGPYALPMKDITETMVPLDIEIERESLPKHHYLRSRRHMWSPLPGYGFSATSINMATTHDEEETYVNLLDLPREVLRAVLDQLAYVDKLTTENVQQALLKVVPALSRDQTVLSMASGTILSQRRVTLHDSRFRNLRQPERYQSEPKYFLDETPSPFQTSMKSFSSLPSPTRKPLAINVSDSVTTSLKLEDSAVREQTWRSPYKKPLPSIGGSQVGAISLTSFAPKVSNLPFISLGLPELPQGARLTRPFAYKNEIAFDFTLEPHRPPLPQSRVGTAKTDDFGSTLLVTIPSACSDKLDPLDIYEKHVIHNNIVMPICSPDVCRPQSEADKVPDEIADGPIQRDSSDAQSLGNIEAETNVNKSEMLESIAEEKVNGKEDAKFKSLAREKQSRESTPEPWPLLNEADFMPSPGQSAKTTRSIVVFTPRVTVGSRNDSPAGTDDSVREIFDENSERQTVSMDISDGSPSPLRGPKPSGEQSTFFSPGPPPPSPEPKDRMGNTSAMTPLREENEDTPRSNIDQREVPMSDSVRNVPGIKQSNALPPDIASIAAEEMSNIMSMVSGSSRDDFFAKLRGETAVQPDMTELEITESGGDHEGFKQELREEYEKWDKALEDDRTNNDEQQ